MNDQRTDVAAGDDESARAAGADVHDHVLQQLFAIGLAMQSTQRKESSPAQAIRIGDHIDRLHDVMQQIRSAVFSDGDCTTHRGVTQGGMTQGGITQA